MPTERRLRNLLMFFTATVQSSPKQSELRLLPIMFITNIRLRAGHTIPRRSMTTQRFLPSITQPQKNMSLFITTGTVPNSEEKKSATARRLSMFRKSRKDPKTQPIFISSSTNGRSSPESALTSTLSPLQSATQLPKEPKSTFMQSIRSA